MKNNIAFSRKVFRTLPLLLGATALGVLLLKLGSSQQEEQAQEGKNAPEDAGTAEKGKRKLGIALVGLGTYSEDELAPALQETKNCYLAGIVTGSPEKAEAWKKKYNIPDNNIYNYEAFDQIADNPAIDIIYIVLPNSMHTEYTIRAARTGKHIICEKPMATSVEDCQRMIDACRENKVMLSIGYRLHFEPYNKRVMELGQQQIYGQVKSIKTDHSLEITDNPGQWRLDNELAGGGPLMDVGIYCVQAVCYTMGKEPVAVTARFGEVTRPDFFSKVEQEITWEMEYENGVSVSCIASYNKKGDSLYTEAERGWWRLEPAYGYGGIKGETSEGKMEFKDVNQQALQMDAFAECVLNNKQTNVTGELGKRDVRILMAIYEAARTGRRIPL